MKLHVRMQQTDAVWDLVSVVHIDYRARISLQLSLGCDVGYRRYVKMYSPQILKGESDQQFGGEILFQYVGYCLRIRHGAEIVISYHIVV